MRDGYWLLHGFYLQIWGPYMCFVMCYSAERKGSRKKNVNQIQRLEKCTHIYSKNVIYSRENMNNPQTPVAHSLAQRDKMLTLSHSSYRYTRRHIQTLRRPHTHLHVWPPHVVLHSSGDKRCSYIKCVMHTVGPNS